jgi:hypothetical protein
VPHWNESYAVDPNCVYVWRGFMAQGKDYKGFSDFLGQIFVPACALLQPNVGLRAYLPTMVPQTNKPAGVPDQTALMFWATPTSHDKAPESLAVRIYQLLHGDVYDMAKSKLPEVPAQLPGSGMIVAEQPYYLLNGKADWMKGSVHHLVGTRPGDLAPTDFLKAIGQWGLEFVLCPPLSVDQALFCCGNDYLVAWIHSPTPDSDLSKGLDALAALTSPVMRQAPKTYNVPAGLWNSWPGIDLTQNPCINIQLDRPAPTVVAPLPPKTDQGIKHFEVPHLALWKSSVAEVLAREYGLHETTAAGVDIDHPIQRATDQYCQYLEANKRPPKPPADSDDEQAVLTYLSYLHHRRAHAKIADNAEIEANFERQTQDFKFGNPLWQKMFVQYLIYYWQYPFHKGGSPKYRSWQDPAFGNGDKNYGMIHWRLPSNARVAIVGDIGTGTDVAAAVLTAALKFKPDAILHLGDIYYSGTSFETEQRLVGLVRAVMGSHAVPFFTVPGNHEYFTGATAFLAALDSGKFVLKPEQRQAASYFSLRTEDDGWQFLGMDTGFNGHYMNVPPAAKQAALDQLHIGPISPSNSSDPHWPAGYNPYFPASASAGQVDLPILDPTAPPPQVTLRSDELLWHEDKLNRFPGRTILLSHHQLYSAWDHTCGTPQKTITQPDGSKQPDPADFNRTWINTGLWRQLGPFFADNVAAWLWGHEHNLCIFQNGYRPADWPANNPDPANVFKPLRKGRCAGHGAIPVAQAEAPYAQNLPIPLNGPNLTLGLTDGWYNRGFEILELAGAGKPARMTYFQVSGADPTPLPIHVETVE